MSDDFDPDRWIEPPPDIDWGRDAGDDFDSFDDDELEQIAAQGDVMESAEVSVQIAQGQLGRRIIPQEIAGAAPYIAQQIAEGGAIDYRAAIDRFYADNPKKKPDARTLRREIMAAAVNDANPQIAERHEVQPPEQLPTGATADQRRDHRRARMAWAMEVAKEQEA